MCTIRSKKASARVESPKMSHHLSTGNWLAIIVAFFACRSSIISNISIRCCCSRCVSPKSSRMSKSAFDTQQWVSFYLSDMLLIYDRGYPGFADFFLHQNKEEPQAFLMRCPLGFSKEVKAFLDNVKNDTISFFRANKYVLEELCKQGLSSLLVQLLMCD